MNLTKSLPLVSVVLATYNGEKYLAQQLDSVFQQTYTNIEVIAVDDASSDNTVHILNTYCSIHSNLKVFLNQSNLGFIKNFEKACSLSKGAFISPCDQDDVWHVDKIKLMVESIEDYPLIYCDSFVCDEQLNKTGKKISDIVTCKNWSSCLQYAVFARIYGHTLLFTRKLFKNIVPFVEVVPHDWWIAYNATLNGGIKFLDMPLVYYRQHALNAFGIIGQKAKKTELTRSGKNKLNKIKARERVTAFYNFCPAELQHEKTVLKKLMNCYKNFSLSNDLKRMLLFLKYKDFFLAPKKYSWLHKNLFCFKMFIKIS